LTVTTAEAVRIERMLLLGNAFWASLLYLRIGFHRQTGRITPQIYVDPCPLQSACLGLEVEHCVFVMRAMHSRLVPQLAGPETRRKCWLWLLFCDKTLFFDAFLRPCFSRSDWLVVFCYRLTDGL
jgi:hypothetical protein